MGKLLNLLLFIPRAIRHRLLSPGYMVQRWLLALYHARALDCVQDHTGHIRKGDILLFATLRNESPRMPFFMDYYRKLGVRHFLFVDNGSDDDFMDLVQGREDVSVWYTQASYKDSNFGMHWLNHLLRRFGCGHWCVTCDPDEFLVFPYCDERNLMELSEFLDSEDRLSLACVMLDMYSDKPVRETLYKPGDDPFTVTPWFDGSGYLQTPGWLMETRINGGVRRRLFFRDEPDTAPSIHKTPFVKWKQTYSYFLSMHQLVPQGINVAHAAEHLSPTGCLMHFKYFSLLEEKVAEEIDRKQHWNNSFEYRQYSAHLESDDAPLCCENSVRYQDWRQLVRDGFMNVGQWF